MVQTRKPVRDAVVSLMASNFNSKFATTATTYGVTAFTIDWSSTSKQFAQSYLDPAQIEPSSVIQFPGVTAYTSLSQNQNIEKYRLFSGTLLAHLDFYVDVRSGLESKNTEDFVDAIEDVLFQILNNPAVAWPAGVAWAGEIACLRESIRLEGDGYYQRLPFQLTFEVNV